MEIYRVNEVWQLALVYQVRIADAKFLKVPISGEFNEEFGKVYEYVLIADGEQGMGTLRLNCDHEDFAKIERVAVIPEKQYKGYGRLLMAEAEAWIKDKGYKKIVIHSKYSASGFYEKLGYTMDEHIELDFGPDEKRQVYFSKEWD